MKSEKNEVQVIQILIEILAGWNEVLQDMNEIRIKLEEYLKPNLIQIFWKFEFIRIL